MLYLVGNLNESDLGISSLSNISQGSFFAVQVHQMFCTQERFYIIFIWIHWMFRYEGALGRNFLHAEPRQILSRKLVGPFLDMTWSQIIVRYFFFGLAKLKCGMLCVLFININHNFYSLHFTYSFINRHTANRMYLVFVSEQLLLVQGKIWTQEKGDSNKWWTDWT